MSDSHSAPHTLGTRNLLLLIPSGAPPMDTEIYHVSGRIFQDGHHQLRPIKAGGCFARRQAMLREQIADAAIRWRF